MLNFNVDRRKCCAMCKYWNGNVEINYNPRTRIIRFENNVFGSCLMYRNQKRSPGSGSLCKKFVKNFLYEN